MASVAPHPIPDQHQHVDFEVDPTTTTTPSVLPGPAPLTGNHVRLERLTEKHFPALYNAIGRNDSLWTFVPSGPFATEAAWNEFLTVANADDENMAHYAVIVNGHTDPSGLASIMGTSLANRVLELGFLFAPTLQRSIEATETAYLVMRLVFSSPLSSSPGVGARRLEWKCDGRNERSMKAAERLGFRFEGRLRQHMILRGRNRDTCYYSILDKEWPACRAAFEAWLAEENFDERAMQRRGLREIRESMNGKETKMG